VQFAERLDDVKQLTLALHHMQARVLPGSLNVRATEAIVNGAERVIVIAREQSSPP